MSVPTEQAPLWAAMPGWGISANLMPREVIDSRHVRVIRRRILIALAAAAVLCVMGYAYALIASQQASSALASEQAQTAKLRVSEKAYSGVTKVQGSVAQVKGQLSGLMTDDVHCAALIDQMRTQLPPGMTIGQLTVTVDTAKTGAAASSSSGSSGGGASLDASDRKHIGTVEVSGTGQVLSDVSTYVDQLRRIPGVVEPYPLTNKAVTPGTQYSLQITLTDELLTHKYDASKNGGN